MEFLQKEPIGAKALYFPQCEAGGKVSVQDLRKVDLKVCERSLLDIWIPSL
jgi:hypothetical protein